MGTGWTPCPLREVPLAEASMLEIPQKLEPALEPVPVVDPEDYAQFEVPIRRGLKAKGKKTKFKKREKTQVAEIPVNPEPELQEVVASSFAPEDLGPEPEAA
jgi:hypothetical protein